MKLEVGVKALIRDKRGRYLLLKRAVPYPGEILCRWDIPGGRIIPGELLFKALKREIKEETGLKVTGISQVVYSQDILRVSGTHTVRLTFKVDVEGKITLNPLEHSEYSWVSGEEIQKMHHDKYLKPIIALIRRQ